MTRREGTRKGEIRGEKMWKKREKMRLCPTYLDKRTGTTEREGVHEERAM